MHTPTTQQTEHMFGTIAPTYDRLNHLLSLGIDRLWRRRSLRWVVDRQQPQQILDLACGTGDYSIAIARRAHPDSHVLGLDLTDEMLAIMRQKVEQQGLSHRIATQQGNAEQLPFASASFDRVTVAFGIRSFEHREQALREIRVHLHNPVFIIAKRLLSLQDKSKGYGSHERIVEDAVTG